MLGILLFLSRAAGSVFSENCANPSGSIESMRLCSLGFLARWSLWLFGEARQTFAAVAADRTCVEVIGGVASCGIGQD